MSKLYFGGIPTRMDVDKLMALDLKAGDSISYQQVKQTIGVDHTENRFWSVTQAWRKRLFREHLLQVICEGGSFHVLTADEALGLGRRNVTRIQRFARRTAVAVEAIPVDELTGKNKDDYNLVRRAAHMMLDATRTAAKEIAPPSPPKKTTLRVAG